MKSLPWEKRSPLGWENRRLKFAASLKTDRGHEEIQTFNYLGMENVESWTGKLTPSSSDGAFNDDYSQSTGIAFSRGNVLFGKLRPYLAKVYLPKNSGICSTEFLVLEPICKVRQKYLFYILLTQEFIAAVNASTFGSKMPRANWDFIGSLSIPIPPLDEQDAVVSYLDRETAEIDALVAEKERMLALLGEKREALISHIVTRGLDLNAPLKSSGLDWLGDIPQHWQIERAKNLFSVRDERSETGEEELLTVSHITGVTPRSEKQVYMFKAEDMTGYKHCMEGDFVTNTLWSWMGAMGISPLDGIVSPEYHVYTFKDDLLPEFMELLCRSKPFIAEVIRWSKGVWSSRLRLYPENFFEIRLPIPRKSEQQEIVAKVTMNDERNKELKNLLTDSITLLKERRSALITAAVTGQIAPEVMTA